MSISQQVSGIIKSWRIRTMGLFSDDRKQTADAHEAGESRGRHAGQRQTGVESVGTGSRRCRPGVRLGAE